MFFHNNPYFVVCIYIYIWYVSKEALRKQKKKKRKEKIGRV